MTVPGYGVSGSGTNPRKPPSTGTFRRKVAGSRRRSDGIPLTDRYMTSLSRMQTLVENRDELVSEGGSHIDPITICRGKDPTSAGAKCYHNTVPHRRSMF